MLFVRKEAEDDIRSAYEWYETKRENLGRAFVVEIDRTLHLIEEQPDIHARCHKSVRRALCHRFPYAIYYLQKGDDIIVIAVLHQRRHPVAWLGRE